jgi:mannitol-1-phosphate 5-dehydrogenase
MGLSGTRTYVGFGFGAIQAGLFLCEAFGSGAFGRLVVAEVVPQVVADLRQARGLFAVNIAHADRVEAVTVGPVRIEDPAQAADRQRLVEAIAGAQEIGTAIPSVTYYVSPGPDSLHRILAEGLRRKAAGNRPRAVVYTAENHNHAAELLESSVMGEIPEAERDAVLSRVRFLNTVIGKMSGVVSDANEMGRQALLPVTAGAERAFLVEAFNRILISKIEFRAVADESPFRRGIRVFEEKRDLLPFEEAKLYGHNATHALAAYIGAVSGVERMAHLREQSGTLAFLRAAFIEESGAALIRRHAGTDALFTREGYTAYADDLLARMTNPYLRDTVERVGRDPARKVGWDDRLVGTMRVALREGIEPWRYAFGTAAALATLDAGASAAALLKPLWSEALPAQAEQEAILNLVEEGAQRLRVWREAGFPDLQRLFGGP